MSYARYWDLTEKQRSELTSEQVEAFLDAELMERGVTRVDAPELLPTEMPELPKSTLYVLKNGYSTPNYGYRTAEEAAAALSGAIAIEHEYIGGTTYQTIDKGSRTVEIATVDVNSSADVANNRKLCEQIAANKKTNDSRLKDYQQACKAVDEAVQGVWDNYRSCQCSARENQRIVDTFNSYVKTSDGDKLIAARFLAKTFDLDAIEAAFTWYGLANPTDAASELATV